MSNCKTVQFILRLISSNLLCIVSINIFYNFSENLFRQCIEIFFRKDCNMNIDKT